MRTFLALFTILASVPAFAGDPANLASTADLPAPAAIAVLLLGVVGIARRRRA